jgi:hypothetical protein
MSDDKPTLDPAKALADIRTLARVALESADPVVMRRDLGRSGQCNREPFAERRRP